MTDVVVEIRPARRWPELRLREVWEHLEVVYILVLRDTKVRYKQSLVGVGWALLQPLLTLLIFTLIFDRMVKVPTGGAAYPPFALAALIPWSYFVHGLNKSTICLVENQSLITRVYFPRLVLPVAASLAALVDFAIAFLLLLAVMLGYGLVPSPAILLLPLFLLLAILTTLGLGLWLSAVNVEYRDVNNALPFFSQILLLATPVAYSVDVIPERWLALYALNPMVTVVTGFRWAMLGDAHAPGSWAFVSVAVVAVVLVGGLYFFRRQEDRFADVV